MVKLFEKKVVVMAITVCVALVMMSEKAEGQGLCNMSGDGLNACRPSVTPPNPTPPTAACCEAVSGADTSCLCRYRNSPILSYLGIDGNLAAQIPAECNLPPAQC